MTWTTPLCQITDPNQLASDYRLSQTILVAILAACFILIAVMAIRQVLRRVRGNRQIEADLAVFNKMKKSKLMTPEEIQRVQEAVTRHILEEQMHASKPTTLDDLKMESIMSFRPGTPSGRRSSSTDNRSGGTHFRDDI